MLLLLYPKSLVTVQVFYHIPGHHGLINQFIWQTFDQRPRYPRIHRFLDHWHREIDAIIQDIVITDSRL